MKYKAIITPSSDCEFQGVKETKAMEMLELSKWLCKWVIEHPDLWGKNPDVQVVQV